MKSELWSKVKRGDYLIYADEYDGVQKVKVTEIDISIEVFEPEYKKVQPYGLTADKGYVKISWKVDEVEHVIAENLANLIRFNLSWFGHLKAAYNKWQEYRATADVFKEVFTDDRAKYREA